MLEIRGKLPAGVERIHFIGIGGSGVFPLVQILKGQGFAITGSDNNEGDIVELERQMGIPVTIGQRAENIAGADMIVYTAAILPGNPELEAAKASGLPLWERAKMLGVISSCFADAICVCGTHGKTTTTALLTQVLLEAGKDPSAVIGGKLPAIGGYGRAGESDVLVCESCEFQDHFLQLSPDVAVILNVDADHLEYFGTLESIIRSFHQFASMASRLVIANGDDPNTRKAVAGCGKPVITFGLGEENDYYARNVVAHGGMRRSFDLMKKGGEKVVTLDIHLPGQHNVLNATAAAVAALETGVTPQALAAAMPHFAGAGRRFEVLGERQGVTVADDYAHHPAEIAATLRAAKELPFVRVWAVFQPFTYSRTRLLMDDFAKALSLADRVVLSEIMGSREVNTYGVSTQELADRIPGSVWYPTFQEMADYVAANARPGDLVITLGCGDVYKCARMILHHP